MEEDRFRLASVMMSMCGIFLLTDFIHGNLTKLEESDMLGRQDIAKHTHHICNVDDRHGDDYTKGCVKDSAVKLV